MRKPRRATLGIVLLALTVGLILSGAWIYAYGPPPKLLHRLMSTRLGDHLAQRMLSATAPAAPPGVTVLEPGDALPPWVLPDVASRSQSLAQWKGQRLVIAFWATWCQPCLKEMPVLAAAQQALGGKHAQIIGIAMDDPQAVRDYLRTRSPTYPMLLGDGLRPDPRVVLGDTRRALPFAVLVDRKGRIVRTHLGGLDAHTLARWLDTAPRPR
jgi:thiol-disulfide isomerase/thioredoxin